MKMSYLLKHKRNIHGLKASATKLDEKQDSTEIEQVVESEEKETWDKDPDIVLGEEGDSELFKGRVVRKGCNPKPVCAPKKRKVETVTREQVESEKVEKQEVSINTRQKEIETMKDTLIAGQSEKKSDSKKDELITIQEETETGTVSNIIMDRRTENQVTVHIDIDKKKNLSQETTVTMDGEKVYSLFNTVKVGDIKSQPQMNLAEYIPSDAVIRPGNIVLKRQFRPDGGRVVLDINYEQSESPVEP